MFWIAKQAETHDQHHEAEATISEISSFMFTEADLLFYALNYQTHLN